jgi:hypothetical protein
MVSMLRSPSWSSSSSSSPTFKETLSAVMSGFKQQIQIYKTDEERIVTEWTARHNFRFPPPLMSDDTASVSVSERFRTIHEEPRPNTLLYLLLSQYNPWLDCEMTREKRAYLKPNVGEVYCAVSASSSTVIDIANLYLWPLLHSRADEVIACRTFADWRRLFGQTITLAFPDYNEWVSKTTKPSAFVSVSERNRLTTILKILNPARVLYLLTTRAGFWPYGPSSSSSSSSSWSLSLSLSSSVSAPHTTTGVCSIKQKIKEYDDTTEIEWLVRADFLKKMKRVHLYIAPSAAAVSSAGGGLGYDMDSD